MRACVRVALAIRARFHVFLRARFPFCLRSTGDQLTLYTSSSERVRASVFKRTINYILTYLIIYLKPRASNENSDGGGLANL